jgi:REP element-mobilizing transposase RayT
LRSSKELTALSPYLRRDRRDRRVSSPHESKGSSRQTLDLKVPTTDYIEFQDRSIAKAYLITFRGYGTWLHGDERGSVDRRYYNRYGDSKIAPNFEMQAVKGRLLKTEPYYLGPTERQIVDSAIREVCTVRDYLLYAVHVRTEHVHVVIGNHGTPERMMDSFKAYATRALRNASLIGPDVRPWSRHGSTRYLWTEEHVQRAVDYVVNGQGGELPEFD